MSSVSPLDGRRLQRLGVPAVVLPATEIQHATIGRAVTPPGPGSRAQPGPRAVSPVYQPRHPGHTLYYPLIQQQLDRYVSARRTFLSHADRESDSSDSRLACYGDGGCLSAEDTLSRSSQVQTALRDGRDGPRQAGKTTLVQDLFGMTHSYCWLDDPTGRWLRRRWYSRTQPVEA